MGSSADSGAVRMSRIRIRPNIIESDQHKINTKTWLLRLLRVRASFSLQVRACFPVVTASPHRVTVASATLAVCSPLRDACCRQRIYLCPFI